MADLAKLEQLLLTTFKDGAFGLPIAYENVEFNPITGHAYAELLIHPGKTIPLTLNDMDVNAGIFRVVLHYPKNTGSITARSKADEITKLYSIGASLVNTDVKLTITNNDVRSSSIDGGMWFSVIIDIFYNSFFTR